MEMNPYQAPEAAVADVADPENLAGRGARFGAVLIDGIIAAALALPIFFGAGLFDRLRSGEISTVAYFAVSALLGFVLFVAVQAYPLKKWAQTWGKRIVGIRIVLLDGGQPTLATLLVRRYLPMQLAQAIPVVGNLMVIVDALFIFRTDRRCVHDLIAGTQVVNA